MDLRRAGTPALSWRRLAVLCQQLATDTTTATSRAVAGELADWTLSTQLLAAVLNALRIANWQRTEDASRRSPKHYPEPVLPPGVVQDRADQSEKFGSTAMTLAEATEWLGW